MLVLHQTNQIGLATSPIGLQNFGVPATQQFSQQGLGLQNPPIQQFQQIVTELEQAEARHSQMLQQIQVEEEQATQKLQYLRQLGQQLAQQAHQLHQTQQAQFPGVQYQAQPFSTFPRV